MTDPKTFLDQQLKAVEADIQTRGEPDCFIVFRACRLHGPESLPVAIYGTRAGLYEKFPMLKFDPWQPAVATVWFDDK